MRRATGPIPFRGPTLSAVLTLVLAIQFSSPVHADAAVLGSGALPSAQVDGVAQAAPPDTLWSTLAVTLSRMRRLEGGIPDLVQPSPSTCQRLSAWESDADLFAARAIARDRDPGLGFEAGLRGDFADQEVDEGVPGAYVGLSWEILQSGLVENNRMAELLSLRSEAAAVEARLAVSQEANRCATIAGALAFSPLLRRLLDDKLDTVEELTALWREAYLSDFGSFEDVLEVEREVERTRSELGALDALLSTGPAPGAVVDWFPPAVDLDIEALLGRDGGTTAPELDLLRLREDEVRLSRRLESSTRLRFYVRYGYRPRTDLPDRQGVSGGVVFRMPLFQDNQAGIEAELESVRRRTLREQDQRSDVTLATWYVFREQLSTVIRGHYAYLENYERVRQSVARWTAEPATADLTVAMNDIIGLHNAALDRALSLRELYKAATEVFAAARQPFDPALLVPVGLPDVGYRGRTGSRSLYVWSDAFNQYANDYLVELARAKGFGTIILSAGRSTRADKLDRFRSAASEAGLTVDMALSTNAWLRPESRAGVAARIGELNLDGGALHLDIEPQALDDFRERQDSLLDAYIDVVSRARAALPPGTELTVSVPVWWDADVYARLDGLVDRMYLMAYESTDPETVARRIAPIVEVTGPDKLVLALRATDFSTEWEMDLVFSHVAGATGITSGAVHDLAGFLTLLRSH